ncbi:FtsX-like permease family protein [Parvibacter caecicola]|uniref:FtsX-like permease family protein n=1 Tax=Parvibacter caecicola TaxID=747645 RepID=UPI00248B2F33|nr:FtsX-like permease family protein [Parvibacter caecicola]
MKAANRDILRTIRGSLGRFIAIAGIVALGTGFYAGLRMAPVDMKTAADIYYDQSSLMDIRVVSTMGLTEGDVEALSQVEGVARAEGAYETDVMTTIGTEQYAMRAHSLPGNSNGSLNRISLASGRWPQAPGECVISADRVMNQSVELGETLHVDEGVTQLDQVLDRDSFTIVGFVHSPYYVTSASLGSTTLGSGDLDQYMYILEEDFADDLPFTEAFVEVVGAKELRAGSEAYQQRVDEVTARIEALAPEREQARLDEIKADAQAELDEQRADYEKEKAEAQQKLADARQQLTDSRTQLDDAKQELESAQSTIENSQAELADGKAQLQNGRAQLNSQKADAQQKLEDAQAQIDEQQAKLDEGRAQAQAGRQQLEQQRAALNEALAKRPELEAQVSQLDQQIAQIDQQLQLPLPDDQKAQLEAARAQLEAGRQQAQGALDQIGASEAAFKQAEQRLLESERQLEEGAAQLEAGRQQLATQQEQAQAQIDAAEGKLSSAQAEIAQGESKLESGRASYEAGRKEYEEGEAKLADGQAEYDEQKADADAQFAEAEQKLADAQADIDAIEMPEWLVMDRTKNVGVVSFDSDADRIDHIASIFPLIFFLVAALVALTTMTRMVEEGRTLVGTYKALGYSSAAIGRKYLAYGAAASVIGSVVGIAVLSFLLPWVVMEAYAIIYYVPLQGMAINWPIALASGGLGVAITLLATWAALVATLRETPAALMLPRAPKAGKRILLEHIGPVWRRLSFSWKVTCRNILRYKKRFFMTVVGIAGCTALLLTGLGLHDAINDIIDKQYGRLIAYNAIIDQEEDAPEDAIAQEHAVLQGPAVASYTEVQTASLLAVGQQGKEVHTTLVVPQDVAAFSEMWELQERVGAAPIALSGNGCVLTEKAATLLDLQVGDEVVFAEQDQMGNASSTRVSVPLTAIAENYVGNYAFMTADAYQHFFGEQPQYRTAYVVLADAEADRSPFTQQLRDTGAVATVSYNDEVIDTYRSMLKSVDMVVVVLVVAAAALAFIVLYNLTNINITERVREIATLKVLGFTRHEVDTYIFREIFILSAIGAAAGLVLGVFLEGFVAVSAEVDAVMFGREIHLLSFALAFVLTMAFTVLVMLFMRRKLDSVNMVESLKSVE